MAETLSVISVISFMAAGVFAILAVVFWFLFQIPTVAGDLSGRNAKKTIERMRKRNEEMRTKPQELSGVRREGEISSAKRKRTEKDQDIRVNAETGLLSENVAGVRQSAETGLLTEENATGILEEEYKTDVSGIKKVKTQRKASAIKIDLIEEILFIHTEEVI